jgi:Secretion system C-terminal sorting domain
MTLERSADGRNFGGIYTITASAVRCLQAFDYADVRALNGINYYRLKMADADGKVTYSTIVALTTATKGFEVINITPNPVTEGRFKLNITSAEQMKMEVMITDIAGRVVAKQSNTLIAGFNAIEVNVNGLANGTYQVTGITAEGRTKVLQFVKQ